MVWYAWVMIIEFVFSAGYKVWQIGRPRDPVTHWEALIAVVELGLFVWAVVALAT